MRTPIFEDEEELKQETSSSLTILESPRDRADRRRITVIKRRLAGDTIVEIADALQVSVDTVKNDIKKVREDNKSYVQNFEPEDFVGESLNVFKRIEEESWSQLDFLSAGDVRSVKFMDSVRSSRKEQIRLLQNSGLLKQQPKQVEVKLTTEVISSWSDHQKDLVSEAIIDACIVDEDIKELTESTE